MAENEDKPKKKGLVSRGKTVRDKPKEGDKPKESSSTKESSSKKSSKLAPSGASEDKKPSLTPESADRKKLTRQNTNEKSPSGSRASSKVEREASSTKETTKEEKPEKEKSSSSKTKKTSEDKDKEGKESRHHASRTTTSTSSKTATASRTMTRRTNREPMPDPEEVMKQFEEILDLAGVSEDSKKDMRKMGVEAQWTFILGNKSRLESKAKAPAGPAALAKSLENPSSVTLETVKKLRSEAGTSTHSWLDEFLAAKGVANLVDIVNYHTANKNNLSQDIQTECLRMIVSFAGAKSSVLQSMMSNQDMINKITMASSSASTVVKSSVFEFLAVLIEFDKNSYQMVLRALDYFAYKMKEKKFEFMVRALKHEEQDSVKCQIMTFINMLVGTPEPLEERIMLRNALLAHNLLALLTELKTAEATSRALLDQIQEFYADMQQDEIELKYEIEEDKGLCDRVDLRSPESIFTGLKQKIEKHKDLEEPFRNILTSMLLLPSDQTVGLQQWLILQSVHDQFMAKVEEVEFDKKVKIDRAELLMLVEGRAKLSEEKGKFFVEKAKFQEQIADLKVEANKVPDLEEKVKQLERDIILRGGSAKSEDTEKLKLQVTELQASVEAGNLTIKKYKEKENQSHEHTSALEAKLHAQDAQIKSLQETLTEAQTTLTKKS